MSHTPGPWDAPFLDDEYCARQAWITASDGSLIATLEDTDNSEANARLIASAPDMYEKLKKAEQEAAALRALLGETREYVESEYHAQFKMYEGYPKFARKYEVEAELLARIDAMLKAERA